ncbi:MAG: hypothetical protein ACYC8T_38195, partial [Myxococcaceae bacterium]
MTTTDGGELGGILSISGVLLVVYAVLSLHRARKARASDLLVLGDGLRIDGGPQHGTIVRWTEMAAPWAEVEEAEAERIALLLVPLFAVAAVGGGNAELTVKVKVWRLWITRAVVRTLMAETDRPSEADSFRAAAATVAAVNAGQQHLKLSPHVRTGFASCSECSAPLVPDDTPKVVCGYCRKTVKLPERFQKQAAGAKAMRGARARTTAMIKALVEQPGAARSNLWLAVLSVVMFAAWPIGWAATARSVLDDGFQVRDVAFLATPFAAVLGGFLFARGRLANRGAMQLLTLGFGALAPKNPGEPPLCRRCLGPLPDEGPGGVVGCRYCQAENIVGIDLRPVVDHARAEQETFDAA